LRHETFHKNKESIMNTLKVLLVDDYDRLRSSMASYLSGQSGVEIVGEAANAIDAVEQAGKLQPDLVLMDLDLPEGGGFEAMQEIKRRAPQTRVVILSPHGSEIYRRMAWRHAADGFIDKGSIKRDLLAVIFSEQGRAGAGVLAATA
jgi:DNA-binding NarL/FixJ family response regulator